MAQFISVLNSDLDKGYWSAIQQANTLEELKADKYYTSGVSDNFSKNPGDTLSGTKTVHDTVTGVATQATMIKRS